MNPLDVGSDEIDRGGMLVMLNLSYTLLYFKFHRAYPHVGVAKQNQVTRLQGGS